MFNSTIIINGKNIYTGRYKLLNKGNEFFNFNNYDR